ncbi:hypothetical protein TRFO_02713 [Tritrichomonas foetus]|uniref:Uncharacterized protein n=1 Tax=Tritrichomonas foetus TaxID=1144522 RepID=A0A1J4KYX4_9EUKA|nr:hypothetical protein TRFO_02713 [Tritrichomonas foetus]|eukprot:OHT16449.1 hypothetical protein TRFO_02713 [Tritrichomonas foetus]
MLKETSVPLQQTFLEEFKKRNPTTNPFYYGFGRRQPLSPFLFRVPTTPKPEIFNGYWYYSPENYSSELLNKFNIKGDRLIPINKTAFVTLLKTAVELFIMRISPTQYKCTVCNHCSSQVEIFDHIVENHSSEITKYLEPHMNYIDDDTEYMTGMLTKLQFDSQISLPDCSPLKKQQFGLGFAAPVIDFGSDDDYDDMYDYEEDNSPISFPPNPTHQTPSVSQEASHTKKMPDRITFKDEVKAPFSVFMKKHPQNLPYITLFEIDPPSKLDNMPSPATLFMPFLDFYLKGPTKVAPKTNNLHLFDNFEEDENNKQNNNKNSKRKSKQPEFVPFIQSIPENLRSVVISNIAKSLIKSYIINRCNQIIGPLLQQKKKILQKKLRDEKLTRARNEERQRLQAMRERRKARIDSLSGLVTEPIIRSFIRNEIATIYEEERQNHVNFLESNNDELNGLSNHLSNLVSNNNVSSNGLLVNSIPVVVSGLAYRRQLCAQFLIDTFGNLNFVLDDNLQPKVRFRLKGNRIEALLYLASQNDINKALSMNPMIVDSCTLKLSVEEENESQLTLFTQQEINFIPIMNSIKNVDKITTNGGQMVIKEMMPYYLPRDDSQEGEANDLNS